MCYRGFVFTSVYVIDQYVVARILHITMSGKSLLFSWNAPLNVPENLRVPATAALQLMLLVMSHYVKPRVQTHNLY